MNERMNVLAGIAGSRVLATMIALTVCAASAGGQRLDCNGNGVDDAIDVATGFSADCNGDGIPDECQLTGWYQADFTSGIPAELIAGGTAVATSGYLQFNNGSYLGGSVEWVDTIPFDPLDQSGIEWSFRFRMTGGADRIESFLDAPASSSPTGDWCGLVVELDHWWNYEQPASLEPNGNHVSVKTANSLGGFSIVHYTPSFDLANGGWHTLRALLRNGAISVWLTPEGGVEEQAFDQIPLPGLWAADLVMVWQGGSGAISGAHYMDDLKIISGPCPPLSVQNVLPRPAWDSSDITILGVGFDSSVTVTIDDTPAPVVSWTPTQLDVSLPPSAPGFDVTTVTKGGLDRQGVLDLWPTLTATSTGLGGEVTLDLEFTGAGLFVTAFSDQSVPPIPVGYAWHGLELDPGIGLRTIGSGAYSDEGEATQSIPVPNDPALAGLSLYLQSWSREGIFQPGAQSFSNTVMVTL